MISIPLQTKVKFGLRGLGLSKKEMTALDGLAKTLLNNDYVDLVIPETIGSLADGLAAIKKRYDSHSDDIPESYRQAASSLLKTPQGRKLASKFIISNLAKLPASQQDAVASAMDKAVDLGMFPETEYESMSDFISNGLIPTIDEKLIQPKSSSEETVRISYLTKCPYCKEHFVP